MEEKDRPKVEVKIGASDLSSITSHGNRTYIPRCLAEVVSKRGYVSFKDFAGMIGKPKEEEAVTLARKYLEKAHKYLEPNRGIEERGNHFVLTFTRAENRNCVTEYGCVCYDRGTLSQSAKDFRDDNRLDPIF